MKHIKQKYLKASITVYRINIVMKNRLNCDTFIMYNLTSIVHASNGLDKTNNTNKCQLFWV